MEHSVVRQGRQNKQQSEVMQGEQCKQQGLVSQSAGSSAARAVSVLALHSADDWKADLVSVLGYPKGSFSSLLT